MMAATMDSQPPQPRRGLVDRIIGLERLEHAPFAWSFVYFFCVLSAYYILRPMRETMSIVSGPETIPFLFLGTFVVMAMATPVYGFIASRVPRRTFLPWVYLFFAINVLIFWGAFAWLRSIDGSLVWLGRVFFVWVSVFNLYVVSVFWSFMADIYTRGQGRRLFGPISAGGSFGALLSGLATNEFAPIIGFESMMPVSALLLCIAIFCITRLRHWVEAEHEDDIDHTVATDQPLGGNPFAGVTSVFETKYLAGIAIVSIIASLLGTAVYMVRAHLVATAITDIDDQTAFFAMINNWQNFIAMLGQLFLVKHVVSRFGIGTALSFLPIVSLAGFAILAMEPTLLVVAWLDIVRRGTGFMFAKPGTDMLYSVVTPEQKYKAKNFIDTAVYRGGDLIGTWSIRAIWALGVSGIALVMLPFAIIWVVLAVWLGRDYRRRARLGIGSE